MSELTGMGDRTILATSVSPLTRQTRHAGFRIIPLRVECGTNPMDESLPCTHTSIGFTSSRRSRRSSGNSVPKHAERRIICACET